MHCNLLLEFSVLLIIIQTVLGVKRDSAGLSIILLIQDSTIAKKITPKLELPAKFTVEGDYLVTDFLEKFELTATMANWDEIETLKYFPLFLDRTALKWFGTMRNTLDWKGTRKALKETFLNQVDKDFPEIRLHERSYDPTKESLHAYYFDKL